MLGPLPGNRSELSAGPHRYARAVFRVTPTSSATSPIGVPRAASATASARRAAGSGRASLRSAVATSASSSATNSAVATASSGLAPLPIRLAAYPHVHSVILSTVTTWRRRSAAARASASRSADCSAESGTYSSLVPASTGRPGARRSPRTWTRRPCYGTRTSAGNSALAGTAPVLTVGSVVAQRSGRGPGPGGRGPAPVTVGGPGRWLRPVASGRWRCVAAGAARSRAFPLVAGVDITVCARQALGPFLGEPGSAHVEAGSAQTGGGPGGPPQGGYGG